jgi:hypothetical protein
MGDGSILDRSGKPYKPATTRGYERSLRLRVLPTFGSWRLNELARRRAHALDHPEHTQPAPGHLSARRA